jgi:hypothetical protein
MNKSPSGKSGAVQTDAAPRPEILWKLVAVIV